MHIKWSIPNDATSIKNQIRVEFELRKKLTARLLPMVDDDQFDEDILSNLELCFDSKSQHFKVCNVQSVASKILFQHISKDELKNQFKIVGTCS